MAVAEFEALQKLSKDLKDASKLLSRKEARYLVDIYYAIQDFRMQAASQIRSADEGEPNNVTEWVFSSTKKIEENVRKALGVFAAEYRVGQWLQGIVGIGPVISAGLLAHLDVRNRPTAGHFIRFAGIDPSAVWEKKTKRPWNAQLKTLIVFKLGESFVKTQNHPETFYGTLFKQRKAKEWQKNLAGDFAEEAMKGQERVGDETNASLWYSGVIKPEWARTVLEAETVAFPLSIPKHALVTDNTKLFPMLPPAHIHARARRFVAKIFTSHLHHVMYEDYYNQAPPMPYAFEKLKEQDHRHYIAPPNWPHTGGKRLSELLVDES